VSPVTVDDLPTLDTEVLVVGAGPTGLMAGLVLARRGVPAIVVDPKDGPTRESRALAVQARTMEIYDQLGLADRVLAGASPALRVRLGQGADVRGFDFADLQRGATRFPGIQIFEQSKNEELLSSALLDSGAPVRWRHRLVDLRRVPEGAEDGVVVLLEGPDGLTRVRCRWCIGADGARSVVRRLLDVPFEGVTDDATFWVADLRGVTGSPPDSITARIGEATFALSFPLGSDGHVRLISLAPSEGIDQQTALETARSDLGLSYRSVDWYSSYRVHHRIAARFRVGPVFLAGDAGHVHSPVGGQGMNTGLQDAHNLANLLADVAQGHREPAALDRYEAERRPVAVRLVRVTDRLFGIVGRRGRLISLARRGVVGTMATVAPRLLDTRLGPRLGGLLGQYRIRYHFTPSGQPLPTWAADAAVGRRLPSTGENHLALRSASWQLHTYGAVAARPEIPDWIDGPRDFETDKQARLRADRVYLVRPDGFVAAAIPLSDGRVAQGVLSDAMAAHHLVSSG
jgi:2-polyprenyl-6-methoxyphenol hydroxylase-like FAD-dependent oxidoreductase